MVLGCNETTLSSGVSAWLIETSVSIPIGNTRGKNSISQQYNKNSKIKLWTGLEQRINQLSVREHIKYHRLGLISAHVQHVNTYRGLGLAL